ncbi:lysine-specific demethylase JMJ28 [Andrographis paniculata]|uniref:lysine-specific demethylase JMJ28 n=1 Tax=Andrographis paniculata TaxID=175694 RepID=UPI0021E6D792|nr:lysine-specific demethylase JMJ28 [Andrographis paniculata]XP_051133678.1 lysine-specific demethylase JMJ28 [Andrographis paniculata]XP_051133679.1 lysine-specific demethylase JMJ28 [Andrographis paniculata]XP_051133680.1 lysine-specific demethylase JMJ28 [Andrographis paniculata]XP_051133681.1 lysine-specific demethylase JMJ28 [Andrographis paniculata]XP_051133682.1 lysine-specific demethylase JMJ28 [Andrographis paniculata]
MRDKEPPPEEFRCKRTDGRQWRCKRRAMEGKTLCEIHHLQGKRRQQKRRVPNSLKLVRSASNGDGGSGNGASLRVSKLGEKRPRRRRRRGGVSEALDDALKKMKLKRGDLQLELIRVFLQRQVEKQKEKEMKENTAGDETRKLPYGVMAIAQSPSSLQKVSEIHDFDAKLGVDSTNNSILQRHFRSKNIEPLPVCTMQVVPFAENVRKKKVRKCHWCRESKCGCLVQCSSCRKRSFCVKCIKDRYLEKQEVKLKCPACCGICSCKLCIKLHFRASDRKEYYRVERNLDRIQLLHYLIHKLLPVLKKINQDQDVQLKTESKVTGKKQSELQIPQTKLGCHTSRCCDKCKASIFDYHRTCTNCSYNLCLHCCWEHSQHSSYQHSSYGRLKLRSCKKRKIYLTGDPLLLKKNPLKQDSGGLPCSAVISMQYWGNSDDGSIPCPPKEIGGCGDGILDLRCVFPFNWARDLEIKAEEILCGYDFRESADVSPCCLLCDSIWTNSSEVKLPGELPRRIGFNNCYLYCPSVKELHREDLVHFQKHWGKGHPVIVRNVLQSPNCLCWDPVIMFSSYMENKCSKSCNEDDMRATNTLDWCEVEIDRKRIFMGSLEKRTHANVQQKFVKFRAWLSSCLFQKQFPLHYDEILSALPLPEYINPVSGLLNVGNKFPKEIPKPDLGPCIYFSYGGPEELMQANYMSKLCYESNDKVNILACATDAPISPAQLKNIENLMKRYRAQDRHNGQSLSNSSDQKGKSSLHSEDTGESSLQHVGEKICFPNGIENGLFYSQDLLRGQPLNVENENLSDDSESDPEESILLHASIDESEDSDSPGEEIESSCSSERKQEISSCGAHWDIFPREDVPKLLEYFRRHSNEFGSACSYTKHDHPILDQTFFLDAYHKLKLKEEFDIQPWTFEQYTGEAIFIPAGCPYQIRKIKSCVNVVLDFISPENATRCIQLNDQIRLLPTRHKVKSKVLEVEKMALEGISSAIEDICSIMPHDQDC